MRQYFINSLKYLQILFFLTASSVIAYAQSNNDYETGLEKLDAEDYQAALKYFGKAAKDGNSDAQYQIGIMYLEGAGMKQSAEDAAYWFRKAAQNGHALSQLEIGKCFQQGIGVQADQRMAAEWYWRAAEQGNPVAALYVARAFRDGNGMTQNLERARKYYKLAAEAGLVEAKEELELLPAPKSSKPSAPSRSNKNTRRK